MYNTCTKSSPWKCVYVTVKLDVLGSHKRAALRARLQSIIFIFYDHDKIRLAPVRQDGRDGSSIGARSTSLPESRGAEAGPRMVGLTSGDAKPEIQSPMPPPICKSANTSIDPAS
jgi:hypothetical protein